MSVVQKLFSKGLIKPPRYVHANSVYETIMGSEAYACADTSAKSDTDIYGFFVPDKNLLFPHLAGYIPGFGLQDRPELKMFEQHHVKDKEVGMEYDLALYPINIYFQLCMGCNPNMVDSLFTPERCVVHRTTIATMVRDRRKLFLHKKAWHTYRGYAHKQCDKMMYKGRTELREFQEKHGLTRETTWEEFSDKLHVIRTEADRNNVAVDLDQHRLLREEYKKLLSQARALPENQKRAESVEKYGYDVKFAYHVVRLMNQAEQILTEHDLDLERCREQLKSIRRGEWTVERVQGYMVEREIALEGLYDRSKIPHGPDEAAIKQLLVDCLEQHFGSLKDAYVQPEASVQALRDIQAILDRNAELLR